MPEKITDLKEEAVYLALKNSDEFLNKTKIGERAKEIIGTSKEIFGDEINYPNCKVQYLRKHITNSLLKKEFFIVESESGREINLKINDSIDVELAHRSYLIFPEDEEQYQRLNSVDRKAEMAIDELDTVHDGSYITLITEIQTIIENNDLYSIAYKSDSLIELLEKVYTKYKSTQQVFLSSITETALKLYLRVWKNALSREYEGLINDQYRLNYIIEASKYIYYENNEELNKLIYSIVNHLKEKDIIDLEEEGLEQIFNHCN